jgi:ABC-type branched-subunit amino acid transport system ATPase component
VAVILAEQFAATALGVATDVAVVVQGRIVVAGKPDDLPDDLADAYLGGAAA